MKAVFRHTKITREGDPEPLDNDKGKGFDSKAIRVTNPSKLISTRPEDEKTEEARKQLLYILDATAPHGSSRSSRNVSQGSTTNHPTG